MVVYHDQKLLLINISKWFISIRKTSNRCLQAIFYYSVTKTWFCYKGSHGNPTIEPPCRLIEQANWQPARDRFRRSLSTANLKNTNWQHPIQLKNIPKTFCFKFNNNISDCTIDRVVYPKTFDFRNAVFCALIGTRGRSVFKYFVSFFRSKV